MLTVTLGGDDAAEGARGVVADAATAATLPDIAAAAAALKAAGVSPTLDASGAEGDARAKGTRADAATVSLAGDGSAKTSIGMGLADDEEAPIPSRLSSLPRSLAERFESLQFLGEGGMGAVYRAKDRRLGRDVALKFLFGGGAEASQRLLREARSQARLEHENACKVYEAGVADGHRFIVMQYIDGEPLDEATKRMTLEEKIRVVRQIASALHEAHRLGLVHRDIKPSNILVETGEDGAFKPYLMDFGLARDVGDRGHTATGAIAGTPAFMAPEQALGDVRSLDRRTDVYSLGATLYDVVCGRPPFLDENIFRLLQRVAREDPRPLKKVLPEVPEDIDAIVMKCLEKDPGRRYESARALGEELQRFLDGEPVQARRTSIRYVVLKKIRRHRAKVALAAAALIVALGLFVAWARERQLASDRAKMSAELGEDVKEMELFLRNAYALPLHDIEREKDVVRARLRGVEERMAAIGAAGEGPGHYALGRGLLALREPERALDHLKRASAAGYASQELDYATGLALGELYKKALEATKRIVNSEQRKARVAAIEAEYKEPALRHLRAALGATLEVPAYVEGLIALYEGKHDEALAKAEEAFARTPWLPDAKKLEGDVHFAEGSRFRPDAAFDYDRMMLHFNRSYEAYQRAAAIARSDPEVHSAECELWIQVMSASQARPESLGSSFDKARLACERGVASSSRSGAARVKTAFAYQMLAWQAQHLPPGREDPERNIGEAIARAEEAVRVSPEDPMASYLLGASWRAQLYHFLNRGIDTSAPSERAIAAYNAAIRLEPTFLWAHNELCWSYAVRALNENSRGVDPSGSVREAVERCDRAIAIDPSFTFAYIHKALARYYMARHLADAGRSPEVEVSAALDAIAAARAKSPDSSGATGMAVFTYILKAAHESDAGRDPKASLELAEQSARDVEKHAPSTIMADELRGMLASARALHLLREGRDPEPELRDARLGLKRIVDEAPWDLDYQILRAQAEIIVARWALREGGALPAELDVATKRLSSMLDKERARPHLYQTLAEIHEIRAAWLADRRKSAGEEITRGLEMAEKALARNPHMATAHAVMGGLHLLAARAARDPKASREAARRAKDALDAALRANPLIARDRRPAIEEVERLLEEPQAR
jgi:serine/threonine-protein kinase